MAVLEVAAMIRLPEDRGLCNYALQTRRMTRPFLKGSPIFMSLPGSCKRHRREEGLADVRA